MKKIRVLSVDDHAFLAEGLRARIGMERDMEFVGHAARASGLVSLCRELAVDVVLLDIEMPGPDPFEAAAELRHQCPNVRTIVLSAYVRDRYVDATVKAGAWGYLAKSDDPDTIMAAIRDVAEGRFTFGPIVLERCRQMGREDSPGRHTESTGARLGETASAPGGSQMPVSRLAALTPRELQILRLIGKGLSRTEIATAIFRSPKTVDAHRSAIMEKLAIHDRVELARFAIREGLVEV
ncbi:MAG: response regulator [Phycisphaerales bacterium]